ncbi:5-formyltetrahydrofolate cyclo-ligase [Clostridium saudiense]|uniref:5-formyltetrahydrofolate cyclo-ligase n=1 Tax=Clostridium saudiense TaxID=1414720 RepID=UPI0018A8E366|nr:5-formyltetrahydrofolate cyclo-ligase [Clostridium saudiense]
MDKNYLRKEMLKIRDDIEVVLKKQYDDIIFKRLINSDNYKNSNKIFTYISFGSEVDTKEFIKYALSDNKEIYVPKTDKIKKEMVAIRISSLDNMSVDKWGILEPKTVEKDKIGEEFDLVIMPGVAFDRVGNRIGYGGGYYDKYISNKNIKCPKFALAYDFQIVDKIQVEEHDIKTEGVMTNKEFIKV